MTAIYHITHVNNLSGMIDKAVLCDRDCQSDLVDAVNIGHRHIKARRARRMLPGGENGTLADYAPFYFAPRSPVLYALHRKNVEGVAARQEEIVHLVSSCEAVLDAGLAFTFTDGHAIMEFSEFYDDLRHLDKVDWEIMRARYWNDQDGTGERPRRRQAEFLVRTALPWALITEIGAMTPAIANQAQEIVGRATHRPAVTVRSGWYY